MFFLPLNDDKPSRFAVATYALIFVNVAIFAFFFFAGTLQEAWSTYAFIPWQIPDPRAFLKILTSTFMHGSWEHVLGNMYFLWVFGRRLENKLGSLRFLLFYLLAGVAADLMSWAMDPSGVTGYIGASGAIAGVMGLCMMLMPWDKISLVVYLFFIPVLKIPLRAIFICGLWFMLQWWAATSTQTLFEPVAFWAHVGGFLAGVLLSIFTPRKPKLAVSVDKPTLPPV